MTVLRLGVVVLLRIAFKKVMLECVSHSVVLAFGGLPPGCGFRGKKHYFSSLFLVVRLSRGHGCAPRR